MAYIDMLYAKNNADSNVLQPGSEVSFRLAVIGTRAKWPPFTAC